MPVPKDRFWFRRVTRNNRYSMHTLKSERKLPCRVSPTAVVFKSAPSVIPGDCENDASIVFPPCYIACKNRAMDEQIGAKRSREGEMSAGNHDFLEDSNRKRFFEYRSIDRSILWRECGEHLDLKLANWKSGKVEFAWVDLNKRRFERCNLTGNQLAMKGWYKETG